VELEKLLKKKQLKVTPQRKAILDVLYNSDCVLNAKQIYERASETIPQVNLSTIYRNLDVLLERDIICRLISSDGKVFFKIRSGHNHHHHIICKNCGLSVTLKFCPINFLDEELKINGFTHIEHRFEVYGYCDKCKENLKKM
jgi:Fe2+ or Zn2+ uptake regulation protein